MDRGGGESTFSAFLGCAEALRASTTLSAIFLISMTTSAIDVSLVFPFDTGRRHSMHIDYISYFQKLTAFSILQFNRAIRMKASVLGYSLNQRGLFGGVVRNPSDRRVKTSPGAKEYAAQKICSYLTTFLRDRCPRSLRNRGGDIQNSRSSLARASRTSERIVGNLIIKLCLINSSALITINSSPPHATHITEIRTHHNLR